LLNTEVQLYSAQFLGLATSVANALATSQSSPSAFDKDFIEETGAIALEHLLRWGSEPVIESLLEKATYSPEAVAGASAQLFFTDKHLWQIAIYSELGGILDATKTAGRGPAARIPSADWRRLQNHYRALMTFFLARVTLWLPRPGGSVSAPLGDLDRGFWRLYPDSRYAGYSGSESPVRCAASAEGKVLPETILPPEVVPVLSETGWDISHARRLVHALSAWQRNEDAVLQVWGRTDRYISPSVLTRAFANNIVAHVWNGDSRFPLFSNYFSGANGWYRVAWDDGTGQCREGTPPFGLSSSFVTGGFVTWARYQPTIGDLALRLYALFDSERPDDIAFVERYYSSLRKTAKGRASLLERLMFWPSLVGSMR